MIAGGTGHRPLKLFNVEDYNQISKADMAKLYLFAVHIMKGFKAGGLERFISGMAIGWDQAMAQAAVDLDIPFDAAVPFKGQESKWPRHVQVEYHELLAHAREIHIISSGGYSTSAMYKRDEWIVDHSSVVAALYDGQPRGGTYHTVQYAVRKKVMLINYWHQWVKFRDTGVI